MSTAKAKEIYMSDYRNFCTESAIRRNGRANGKVKNVSRTQVAVETVVSSVQAQLLWVSKKKMTTLARVIQADVLTA